MDWNDFKLEIVFSKRRSLQIKFSSAKSLNVRAPLQMPSSQIISFLEEKKNWISEKSMFYVEGPQNLVSLKEELKSFKLGAEIPLMMKSDFDKLFYEEAETFLTQRQLYWQEKLPELKMQSLKFRAMKSRWGSCSRKAQITLNRYLYALPIELIDMVIVHEMVHIKYFDHGENFYKTLFSVIEDGPKLQKDLKSWGMILKN